MVTSNFILSASLPFSRNIFVLLILTALLFSCREDDTTKADDKEYNCINTNHSGYTTIVHEGVTREYILYVPTSYESNTPSPLIINFHGYGGCASNFSSEVGDLNSLADSENFIIAYPQAVVGEKGDVYWNPEDNGIQNIEENDVFFTEQLIEDISNKYTVNSSQVYATGYSNGGMMSYGLACSKGDLIAAIGIMSGIMLEQTCDVKEYTSIIHFHSTFDNVLPYDGNQNYQSVSDVVNFWLSHNGIPASNLVTIEFNDGNMVRKSYTGGNENTSVVLYTDYEEQGKGGHVWFNGAIDGNSPNQILWDFLSSYSLND